MRMHQKAESQSLVGRYRWLGDSGIESSVQLSANRSGFEVSNVIKEERLTFDIDYQSRYSFAAHDLLWGFSHRSSSDDITVPGTAYDYLISSRRPTPSATPAFSCTTTGPCCRTRSSSGSASLDHASRNGSYADLPHCCGRHARRRSTQVCEGTTRWPGPSRTYPFSPAST
jgi:iron complex outermembrane receptor protein